MLNSKHVFAVGLGAYFDIGFSHSIFKTYGAVYQTSPFFYYYNYGKKFYSYNIVYGGGLTLDTCVAHDNLFNYRLKITFENYEFPYMPKINYYMPFGLYTPNVKQSFHSTLKLGMKHIFGFKISRIQSLSAIFKNFKWC
jgi:hypothetical protein